MGSSWNNLFSVQCIILVLLNATQCFCIKQSQTQTQTHSRFDECSALLQFKESFTFDETASTSPFAYPKLASWPGQGHNHENQSNCCSWDGVECNDDKSGGHVTGLDLSSSCLYGSLNSNSSLFSLVHLQRLDLSDNNFDYSQIPSRFGHDLTSLTYLNLSRSVFSGQIPFEISKLSKLSTLDLSFNANDNPLKMSKGNLRSLVQNLTHIKQLHLSEVVIYSTVPHMLVNASFLTSLRLSNCGLHGEFPVGIFHLPNLEVLYVYENSLTGYFPTFNTSNFFKKLDVADTKFSGQIPASIGNLHSLNVLAISSCNFYPHVPSSFRNLTQLSYLDMSAFYDASNNISMANLLDSDSFSWVGNLTKLYHLNLGDINLRANFPNLANLSQLEYLNLRANVVSGQIPSWLMKLPRLTALNLEDNNLQGEIPSSLFQHRNLENLDLSNNNLSGLVEFDQFSILKKLKGLDLSNNYFSVQFKTNLSATFPKLETLGLALCNLTEFPEFLRNQFELTHLDLSDNNIHGQIPMWVWNATGESLSILHLYDNYLTGFEQNPGILPWKNLNFLTLGDNMFQGSLPVPPPSIRFYAVEYNEYTGEIPPLFCTLNHLQVLEVSNNNLSGMLPRCLGNSSVLEILSLHNNCFHGDIPPIFPSKSSLRIIDLSYNWLQGKLPRAVVNCTQLKVLNLGNNQMVDIFPSCLGALPALRILILRSNRFHGMIGKPATNHEFPNLCIIDLSNNHFSGTLPSNYLANWNAMKMVDQNKKTYFELYSDFDESSGYYYYHYSMTIVEKGVQLKYKKTPYLLKLIDFSSNRFEGEIPAGAIGNLRGLVLLNLSNNTLTGHIPSSLGNLTALESLDLSGNQLSGRMPSNLAQLNFLAYFNVSNNHLWGPVPLGEQFDTFQEDSYQGNLGLCGKTLPKKCDDHESSMRPPSSIPEEVEDSGFQIELDWYVVLSGVVSGLIVGFVSGNIWTSKNHEWFDEKFSRRRQPRGTRGRRGRRT